MWRKLEDSGLLQMPNTYALFTFLLIKAAHAPRKIGTPHGVVNLARGEYISGRLELALALKQTEREIRTGLDRLKELEILTIKSTSRYSIYTIVKYDEYQASDQQTTSQTPTDDQLATNGRPTDDQQATTKQTLKTLEELKTLKEKPLSSGKKPAAAKIDTAALQASCKATWSAYGNAYLERYSVAPTRNAKVSGIIKQFVLRIGMDESPNVAAFYVWHNEGFYVKKLHPVELLLKDAEGLRTQWATNTSMTAARAQQIDKTQTNASVVDAALKLSEGVGNAAQK